MLEQTSQLYPQTTAELHSEPWWGVVRKIAQFLDASGLSLDQEQVIRYELDRDGYEPSDISKAFEWLESVMQSGTLRDSLNLFMDSPEPCRVIHPLEFASTHPRIIRSIMTGYHRGYISLSTAERMLEGARLVDTRDWTDMDVESFIKDLFGPIASGVLKPQQANIIYN